MNPGTGLNFQANEAMNTPQSVPKTTLQRDTGRVSDGGTFTFRRKLYTPLKSKSKLPGVERDLPH